MDLDLSEVLLEDAASELSIPDPCLVEKDYHVTRILKALEGFECDTFDLVFAGGTCLSKTVTSLGRMSEDIDLKFCLKDQDTELTGNQLRKSLSRAKSQITDLLNELGYNPNPPKAENANQHVEWEVEYEEILTHIDALRPSLQVEATFCPGFTQYSEQSIGSMIALASGENPEVENLYCVDHTYTASEKMVSLLRRTAGVLRGLPWKDSRLVRHIYDIHVLERDGLIDKDSFTQHFQDIVDWDANRFQNQHPAFLKDPFSEMIFAMEELGSNEKYVEDYANFLSPLVYSQDYEEDYAVCLKTIEGLFYNSRQY